MPSIISASTTSGTALNFTADTSGVLALQTGATPTTALTIDTAQNVGIGTSSPGSFNAFANQLVVGNGSSSQGITVFASNASSISFADGTAGTAPFQGYITYNHVSDYMAFYANYSGSSSPRLLINSNGTTILQGGNLAANGTGITFPATQSASSDANTLDDYEEGNWTPVDGSGAGLSFTNAIGRYVKIGRQVTAWAYFGYPSTANGNNSLIDGLPFTSAPDASARSGGMIGYSSEPTFARILGPGSSTNCVPYTSAGGRITNATFSTDELYICITYYVS